MPQAMIDLAVSQAAVRFDGRPPCEGVAAATAIAERIETRFIYCTGSNQPRTIKRLSQDHPFDILIKPIDPNALGASPMRAECVRAVAVGLL
jgi:hypothetical protein